jgi:hypothetical protein
MALTRRRKAQAVATAVAWTLAAGIGGALGGRPGARWVVRLSEARDGR